MKNGLSFCQKGQYAVTSRFGVMLPLNEISISNFPITKKFLSLPHVTPKEYTMAINTQILRPRYILVDKQQSIKVTLPLQTLL